MKKLNSFLKILVLSVVSISSVFLISSVNAAGSATLTLSPSSGSYTKNSSISIVINENSGSDAINVVEADLTYDQTKLQFVSVDATGSDFDFPIASSGGGGSIQVVRGISNAGTVTGSKKLATIKFTALDTGSAVVSFAGTSTIVRPSDGENVWNGSATGGTYTVTAPAPPAAPPATPPATTPPATTAQPNTTTPTASGASSAPVAVTTAVPAADDQPVPTTADVSNDGYLVAVQVFEEKSTPIAHVEVELDGAKKAKTDLTGVASFQDVTAGEHKVKVNGTETKITVVAGDKTAVQSFSVTAKRPYVFEAKKVGVWILVGLGSLAVLVFILLVIKRIIHRPYGFHGLVPPKTEETALSTGNAHQNSPMASEPPDATVIQPTNPIPSDDPGDKPPTTN